MRFALFNGETVEGQVVGFSPYSITVRSASEDEEVTLRKLAIAYYRRPVASAKEEA
jgi:sRNA-binding regulator protein Hfq